MNVNFGKFNFTDVFTWNLKAVLQLNSLSSGDSDLLNGRALTFVIFRCAINFHQDQASHTPPQRYFANVAHLSLSTQVQGQAGAEPAVQPSLVTDVSYCFSPQLMTVHRLLKLLRCYWFGSYHFLVEQLLGLDGFDSIACFTHAHWLHDYREVGD